MRDLDRWKDKVELSLDGRQIFFLFFGSALAACLIFVVGMLIGKRLEARAFALQPPPVEDPLAALDQLGDADEAADGLTFHKTLTQGASKPRPTIERAVENRSPLPESPKVSPVAKPPLPTPAKPELAVVLPTLPPAKPPLPTAKPASTAERAPLPPGKPQVVVAQAKTPPAGHFTLQLSAFPERSQAEEFMRKIQSAGYRPYVVASEIPGKGVFYRVRVGDFMTKDAATSAKADFERKQRLIAYVARL